MSRTFYETAWEMANAIIHQPGFENFAFHFVVTVTQYV